MTVLRDLRGLRSVVLAGVVALVLTSLAFEVAAWPDAGERGLRPADAPVVVLEVAAVLALFTGLTLWLRAATENQRRLGAPVHGGVWLRAVVGVLVPVLGTALLFQLALRILHASGRAAGTVHGLGAWFGIWVVAYVAAEASRLLLWPGLFPDGVLYVSGSVFMALSLPGLARFLRTVKRDQERATGVQAPPAAPPASPASSDA